MSENDATNDSMESSNPLLGPVNTVMQNIFDAFPDTEVESDTDETERADGNDEQTNYGREAATGNTTAEPDLAGDEGAEVESDEAAPLVQGGEAFRSPAATVTEIEIVKQIGELSNAVEQRFAQEYETQAVYQIQEEYPQYIELLNLHPMELVNQELPTIDGTEGTVLFRTTQEVKDWQDAVKAILQREVRTYVAENRQEYDAVLNTVHDSIQLFQDNPDLIPNSPVFNKQLADEFIKIAEPYSLTLNGKLVGFSIPVQGIINQLRTDVRLKQYSQKNTAPKKSVKTSKPQGGIRSKAGASGADPEDFSPMWKALGIDNMPV